MQRRRADLDHLEAGRRFEHTVADLRRLQDAVAGEHHERLPLVLVDETHPARLHEDHLEADLVEVHVVGDGTTIRDRDVRRHEGATPTVGEQVPVPHAGPSDARFAVVVGDHERRLSIWHDVVGRERPVLDRRPARQRLRSGPRVAEQVQHDRTPDVGGLDAYAHAMGGHDRRRRRVGREDGVDAKAVLRRQRLEVVVEAIGGEDDVRVADAVNGPSSHGSRGCG